MVASWSTPVVAIIFSGEYTPIDFCCAFLATVVYFIFWLFPIFPYWFLPIGHLDIALEGGLTMVV